jgi:hypothetical protein
MTSTPTSLTGRPTAEPAAPARTPSLRRFWSPEVGVAVAAFAALCVAVLMRSMQLLEPDDYAYRASIEALVHGHVALSNDQYTALSGELGQIMQWVQLPNGSWISEKNPGYPFFAAPFAWLGILRAAPLFYGALGCIGLYAGGRRWLGRWGGTWAVALYCASGAALVFAWRATMPTFTDASLIAAGTGALLWTMLAADVSTRRRTVIGLLAFLALEGAVAIRYTNVVVLVVALAAVALGRRAARLPWRSLAWWLGSVGLLALLIGSFDQHYYGGVLKTGYTSGEITFDLSALRPNIEHMPYHLVRSMPFLLLGLAALGWIAVRGVRSRHSGLDAVVRAAYRRDAAVAAALALCWLGIFGLYAAYTWTVGQASNHGLSVHVIRFYLPALASVALLAAWLLTRLPALAGGVVLVLLAALALWSYPGLADGGRGGPGGPGGGFGGVGGRPAYGTPPGRMQGGRPSGLPLAGQAPPNGMRPPSDQAPPGGASPPGSSGQASGSF